MQENHDRQVEVIRSIEDEVAANLHLLADVNDKWWPAQIFEFMQGDYEEPLRDLREQASNLRRETLIVLTGNAITEEALPNYASRLANMFPDPTGTSDNPWSQWQRGWNAEENLHKEVLNQFALLSGRINMQEYERAAFELIRNGFEQNSSLFQGILYPMFQEQATRLSHFRTARQARSDGCPFLGNLCDKVAQDEARHARFYFAVGRAVFKADPQEAMIAFYNLMRQGIQMPARLMASEKIKAPALFEAFSSVAEKLEIYTGHDYGNILGNLNRKLETASMAVSGDAARAQEYLCKLPEKVKRVYERTKNRVQHNILQPAWVHD